MRIEVHSRDHELLQCIDDLTPDNLDREASKDSRRLAIVDARHLSEERLRAMLAEPNTFGDLVLVLVDSEDKLNDTLPSLTALTALDFLVWPAPRQVLKSRIRCLAHYLEPQPLPSERVARDQAFHAIIDQLPLMIFLTESGGQDTYMNASMRRFFGVKAMPLERLGWHAAVHPEDRDALKNHLEYAVMNRQPYEMTTLVTGGEDEWHTVHVNGRPHYYGDGSFAGMVESLREVTEERVTSDSLLKSMRMFKELANMVPLLIWQSDANGTLTYANDRWHAFTGLPRESLRWGRFLDAFHPVARKNIVRECRRAKKNPQPFRLETRIREQGTGQYRWHATLVTPILDESGRLKKWIGSAMDIDVRKINAEEIKHLYREMEKKQQAKDNFLAALSHELRTPLNVILGYCNLLLETLDLGPLETDALQGIVGDANQILAIVEQLPWRDLGRCSPTTGDDAKRDAD